MFHNNKERYIINVALSTSLPLIGAGDECIIDKVSGEVIARFYNGNFVVTTAKDGLIGQEQIETKMAA